MKIGDGTNLPLLNAVTASGAGEPQRPIGKDRAIQVDGISGDTVLVQVSNDDTNWYTVVTVTADGHYQLESTSRYMRANVSVYSAGTITASVTV